ncbi:MAG: SMC-Scp complex subunit ScpB, partial [Candidatus Thermoplasmatota archaeon]
IARKDLDRNTLKVAALIAYYQPMTKKDLVEMAGPKAWEHAELLQKAGLVLIRRKGPGYSLETGQRFLEYFGIAARTKEEIRRLLAEKAGVKEQSQSSAQDEEKDAGAGDEGAGD